MIKIQSRRAARSCISTFVELSQLDRGTKVDRENTLYVLSENLVHWLPDVGSEFLGTDGHYQSSKLYFHSQSPRLSSILDTLVILGEHCPRLEQELPPGQPVCRAGFILPFL